MSKSVWPWFEFPLRHGARDEMFTLFDWHRERPFIKLNTAVPDHPSVRLVQVVTFLNVESGYQALFTESARQLFERTAAAFLETLPATQRAELEAVARERRVVAEDFGAGEEELYALSPEESAEQFAGRVDEIVESPGSTFIPTAELPGA